MRRLMSLMSCVVAFVMALPRTSLLHFPSSEPEPCLLGCCRPGPAAGLSDDRRMPFAAQYCFDRAFLRDRKYDDRHPVFAGKRERGAIHDLQVFLERFLVAELVVTLRFRVLFGVGGIN